MAPFTPGSAAKVLEQLGVAPEYDDRGDGSPGWDALLAWGGGAAAGDVRRTGEPVPLFPRTELPEAVS
jgi:hypothetical protein